MAENFTLNWTAEELKKNKLLAGSKSDFTKESEAIYAVLDHFANDLKKLGFDPVIFEFDFQSDAKSEFDSLKYVFMVHSKNNIALRAELFSVEIYKNDQTKIFFTGYPIKLGSWTICFSSTEELKKIIYDHANSENWKIVFQKLLPDTE